MIKMDPLKKKGTVMRPRIAPDIFRYASLDRYKKNIMLICFLVTLTGCAVERFERRHTPSFNFSKIGTFSFDDRKSGIVGIPENEKNEMIAYIKNEIKKELLAQGFIPVGVHPDVRIRFALILKGNGKNVDPQNFAITQKEEKPKYMITFDYKPGSLILDAAEPFFDAIVWRSSIDTKIEAETSLGQKKKQIVRFIKELLKDFPPLSEKESGDSSCKEAAPLKSRPSWPGFFYL